jgi:Spy/CpxP family protein refolding chaperone
MHRHFSRHRLVLFCGLLCVALLASTAIAQQKQRGGRSVTPGGGAEGRMMKAKAKEIGLSEEVVAKIDAAIEANKAAEATLREENRESLKALNELLKKSLPTEKELMAASEKIGDNASKSRVLKMKSILEVRSLLTAEQLEKFMELRNKATARR